MDVCRHIQTILDHEEKNGNTIKEKSEGWSKANLVIDMDRSLDIDFGNALIDSGMPLQYWENNDPHYSLQKGFFCKKSRQSIAGPK